VSPRAESGGASIALRRGMCFGPCPAYEVTLHTDGTATWSGEVFVDKIGVQQGTLPPAEVNRLLALFQRFGFFDWADTYDSGLTDVQELKLTVTRGAHTKMVRQRGVDEPADFWLLTTLVDGVAARVDWSDS
jgi:hypothetical protein